VGKILSIFIEDSGYEDFQIEIICENAGMEGGPTEQDGRLETALFNT
jgi:hypothetical protein